MGLSKRSTTKISHQNNLSVLPTLELLPPFGAGSKAGASGIWAADVPAMKRSFQLLEGLSQVRPPSDFRLGTLRGMNRRKFRPASKTSSLNNEVGLRFSMYSSESAQAGWIVCHTALSYVGAALVSGVEIERQAEPDLWFLTGGLVYYCMIGVLFGGAVVSFVGAVFSSCGKTLRAEVFLLGWGVCSIVIVSFCRTCVLL